MKNMKKLNPVFLQKKLNLLLVALKHAKTTITGPNNLDYLDSLSIVRIFHYYKLKNID